MAIIVKYNVFGYDQTKRFKNELEYDKWAKALDRKYGEDGWQLIYRENTALHKSIRLIHNVMKKSPRKPKTRRKK